VPVVVRAAVASLAAVERAALAGAAGGTRLEVVSGPAGPAWMPVAVFFARRGHAVFRVSSAKAADLRRFLRRHAKSNGIDAETLARLPLAGPGGLRQLELPGPAAAAPGPAGAGVRPADAGWQRAQGPDQGPGPAAAAGDPAGRRSRQGRSWRCSNATPIPAPSAAPARRS